MGTTTQSSKKISLFFFMIFLLLPACFQDNPSEDRGHHKLTVYAYDSFANEWGIGPLVTQEFEKKCQCRLELIPAGDGAELLTRLELENQHLHEIRADVAIGIDGFHLSRARTLGIFKQVPPPSYPLRHEVQNQDLLFFPFDWGVFSLVRDTKNLPLKIQSIADLTQTTLQKKLLLQDPRTSTPGMGFLLTAASLYPSSAELSQFLKKLKPNLLTITPGWSLAYGMFKKGEAPLVWSYTTSPVYHLKNEGSNRYQADLFKEGSLIQIEYVAVTQKGASNPYTQIFLEVLFSQEIQSEIPLKNYMYPARKNVKLPKEFDTVPLPKKILNPAQINSKTQLEWISLWKNIFQN